MNFLASRLRSINEQLLVKSDLRPSNEINSLFGELVELILKHREINLYDEDGLVELAKEFSRLPLICAEAEGLMEKEWARYFISKEKLEMEALKEFIYYPNYEALMDWEYGHAKMWLGKSLQKVLFVGSGSLPLSAILMAQKFGVEVDCLEKDSEAVENSRQLIAKLGVEKVTVIEGDFFEFGDFKKYDLMMIAALVGENAEEKRQALKFLKNELPVGGSFLMRFGSRLSSLLYADIDLENLRMFEDVEIFHPQKTIINSFLLAKQN